MKIIHKKRRFSIIELLVSIAVIAILASMIMLAITDARQKAIKTQGKNRLRQIGYAIQMYMMDHGQKTPSKIEKLTPQYVTDNTIKTAFNDSTYYTLKGDIKNEKAFNLKSDSKVIVDTNWEEDTQVLYLDGRVERQQ